MITWSSHKAHRPLRYTGAAETFAAGEGIDVAKIIANACSFLLAIPIPLVVAVDSKDLFTSLATRR